MYWLISLPLIDESYDRTWATLKQKTAQEIDWSSNYRFTLPELRVGTLDSLMVLSDDLVKVNSMLESVVNKIRRQLFEMQAAASSSSNEDASGEVLVESMPPDAYIEKFKWNEAKYPPRRPLSETVTTITETVSKLEEDLKIRVVDYNQLKGQASQSARKQTGSLAVRDLSTIVKASDVTETENITTLFVVVGKHTKKDWLENYEVLSDYVVPRSSKVIWEDNEYSLVTVSLFKRVVDTFKTNARGKGYQVRDYQYDPATQKRDQEAGSHVKSDLETKRSQLEEWSSTAYGEAFSAWIHICAIRLFTESILRYGLPPKFLSAIMKPNPKFAQKLRKALATLFSASENSHYEGDVGGGGMPAAEGEMYPYVSFTISIDG
ncbi:hypothetical protein WJX84_006570 [Apatococcus fuscideae]|uniref:V-type proton ATPase subunit C n=1 Tax=Apatococcus fuscideae TaxID=2026836 RepID=A0AAW1T9D5_9CHLO